MANKYNIVITATDRATAVARAIKGSLRDLVKPITDTGRAVRDLGKEVGVDKVGKSLLGAARGAAALARGVGGIGGALVGAVGVGSISALAAWSKQWSDTQRSVSLTAIAIGTAARDIQSFEGAGKLFGLAPGQITGGLGNIGTTLQDAITGRNQTALIMMSRMGMQVRRLKDGSIDAVGAMEDLADVISKMNAPIQTKALVAQTFGVGELLPLLLKGRKGMEELRKEADRIRPPLSDADRARADAYNKSIQALGLSFDNLGNSIMHGAMPGLNSLADWFTKHNNQAAANVEKFGFWDAMAKGAANLNLKIWKGIFKGIAGIGAAQFSELDIPGDASRAALFRAQERQESGGRQSARSGKGAIGVMQLMPETALETAAKHGIPFDFNKLEKDAAYNRTLGRAYMSDLLDKYGGDQTLALAAYNAGPGAVDRWIKQYGRPGQNGLTDAQFASKIPYGETRNYIASIFGQMGGAGGAGGAGAGGLAGNGRGGGARPGGSLGLGEGAALSLNLNDNRGATDLAELMKGGAGESHATVRVEIAGAPPGTKAAVVDTKGNVTPSVKVEHSMPEYSL